MPRTEQRNSQSTGSAATTQDPQALITSRLPLHDLDEFSLIFGGGVGAPQGAPEPRPAVRGLSAMWADDGLAPAGDGCWGPLYEFGCLGPVCAPAPGDAERSPAAAFDPGQSRPDAPPADLR